MSEASAAGPSTTLRVTAKFFPLAFVLYLTKPTITIDGAANTGRWGDNDFAVAPGRHTVKVAFRYLFIAEAGKNQIDVDVAEGTTVNVRFSAPWLLFMAGRLKIV